MNEYADAMPVHIKRTFKWYSVIRVVSFVVWLWVGVQIGFQAHSQDVTNGLSSHWVADDYVSGGSWVDRIKGVLAATDGAPTPVAVAAAFGVHNGVMRNTGPTGAGGFLIPGGNPPTGLTNYTIAVVFQAAAGGPSGGSYYSDDIIFGYDTAGAGQPDWGISWGGSSSLVGQGVIAGIGRSGGDSGVQSGGTPLALNTTHAAVLQINGSSRTETLFVDGAQVGQNTGITILAPINSNGNGKIPLLSSVNSTIATAFTGPLAEVRVYTNATVSGTALSSYLQNYYFKNPTINLSIIGPNAAPVGGKIALQVTIPVSASQAGPFTVTLNSSNTTVVASTNLVVAAGVISTNIFVPIQGVGTATITASGAGVLASLPVAITGYPAGTRYPIAWFKADAITGTINGGILTSWTDSSGDGYNATQGTPSQAPVYVTNAMHGLPVVRFTSTSSTYLSFPRPVQDDFSIICVFQSTQGLYSGDLFYSGAGLVNGEVGGVVDDFGICLFANGSIAAGTGNPDVAVDSAAGYNDGNPHIFTFTRTRATGLVSLYVDGTFAGTTTGGTQSLTSPSVLVLGAQQTINNFLSGDIAEVQVYNTALSGTDQQAAETSLFAKYSLPPPAPAGLYLQLQDSQIVLNWQASSGAKGYYVRRSTAQNGTYTTIATNLTTTFADATVSPTNTYFYVVAAFSGNGQSANSVAVSTATISSRHEPLGPSSRKTPIAISEIMWKPAPRTDGKNLEFVEIYNSNPWFQDISGYTLTCADIHYTFPSGTTIASNSFMVIAAVPADIQSAYGLTNVMGPYTGSLKKAETLQLLDEQGAVLLTVPYSNVYPWPVATGGTGHSLILSNPSYGEGDPRAWDISTFTGGSPGSADVYPASPYGNVVINEILPHSENAAVPQFIELYNHGNSGNNISGCILTDDPTTNKFVIPAGTIVGPASFICFTQTQLGFNLNGAGETLYLIGADGSRILDAVQFGAQADGVSYGRWPDGANDFYAFTSRTPGTNNSAILIGDIVINELMYDPISGNDDDQYLELYNKGTNTANLTGWQFTAGVTFTFPNVSVAPNGYLVVARNTANLFAKYPNLNSGNTVGNYSGKLSHGGEQVTLSMPQSLYTNTPILVAEDQVTYGTGGRWGEWSGGNGSSLELKDPRANHRLAANWADSDESQKSSWTNIEFTGVLDNGFSFDPAIDYAQIGILDIGECLVDNVEVDGTNRVNYVSNPTFETGTNGWSFQGSQVRSSLENSGYQSSLSLHVRASDHYYNGDDSCQVALNPNSLAAGQTATLRFKARWIHGWPEVILRLNGGWLEAAGSLPVAANLGTPGAPNSQYVVHPGPAIYNVTHNPALPAANQPVVVSVQVHDPNGVTNLTLNYRLDPATSYTSVPLKDDGTAGDVVAGDGIFSATIPGQAANTLAAFYISAADSSSIAARFPALRPNDNEPARECLVLFGDGNPGGSFGVYHLWLTQSNVTRWANLGNLSNEGTDGTMVEANRVIYNMQARFAGSPVHQYYDTPNGTLCSYKWIFNDDDKFLGATSFNKIHNPGNTGNDPTYQREQLANTFLRALHVPWLNRRDVVVYVNGNRRGPFMEDAQTPDGDLVKEYFPEDSGGYLYKIARWFEFGPFLNGYSMPNNLASEAMIMPFATTGGAKKPGRYRFTFENRRTADSENNYSDVFSLIDAASSQGTPNYVRNMENLADMENWMRVFAANHAAGNWDSFGCSSGQNLYPYIGTLGTKWSLLMFDFNIGLGIDGSYPPGQSLFVTLASDSNMTGIYNEPTFLRMYWRALGELVINGPLNLSLSTPLMNAKFAAISANGITVEDPNLNLISWLTQASPLVAAQVMAANATDFSVNASVVVSNNLAYLTGQAPFNVNTIRINGAAYPLTWTTVTNWAITVPLQTGTNQFSLVGVDRNGQIIAGDSNIVSVVYAATNASPVGHVVINEIMYAPSMANAQFVELYNNSANTSYDLSGWQLPDLSYTFPNGAVISPTNYLVLVANGAAFAGAYGATNPVFDVFSGTLSPNSETLTLNSSSNSTVAKVKYESQLPWPINANGTGASLQLIDSRTDNWRVGNWSFTTATPAKRNTVATALAPFPTLWINELQADNFNSITNRAGLHTPWVELYNPGTNVLSLSGLFLANNYTNLLQWAFPNNASINAGQFEVIFADALTNLSTTNELHTSFVLPGGSGSLALTRLATNGQLQVLDYVNYQNINLNNSYGSFPDGQSFYRQEFFSATPGTSNNGTATPPPSFIAYTHVGSPYTQNFDALPNPGATSVNADNPVTNNDVIYSLANPYDFAFPVIASGGSGGLGISALAGWYGSGVASSKFGITEGDQTTGGQISFGLPNSSNRALGLLATSSTKGTAFGVRFLNGTTTTLTRLNLQFTGEVWRQSNLPKTLQFYYFVDLTGTNGFATNRTAYIPALNVSIPTVAADVNGVAVDGTMTFNQTNLSVWNQAITNWPPDAALWLVWQMTDTTGKAQGLGIDNLTFSASIPLPVPLNVQASGTNIFINWTGVAGQIYQLESKTNLTDTTWAPIGNPMTGSGETLTLTNSVSAAVQGFFRLRLVN